MSQSERLKVLVVDDSAVVRQIFTDVLGQTGDMEVVTAADPLIAMTKMERGRPDVIVLDLEMPRMDGLTFLRKLMAENPLPVVICSGLVGRGSQQALQALEQGAVGIIAKPRLGIREFLYESALMMIDSIRGAAKARIGARSLTSVPCPAPQIAIEPKYNADVVVPKIEKRFVEPTEKVVVIGASTGGTEALRDLFSRLPISVPGIVVVQHMPETFTRAFADRLNTDLPLAVKEAEHGDRVTRGTVLIAPGNRHLMLARCGRSYMVEVKDGPLVSRHRPSVDVLFRSAAQCAGGNALGIILTGMGDDGAAGMNEMLEAGARTIAQDEHTCVVYGMPREAVVRGAAERVLPLHGISGAIMDWSERFLPAAQFLR